MNKTYIKKGLAIAVILLFIGVALAPSINSNIVKDDLVEVTTEFCGIEGLKPHTIKISKNEVDKLKLFIDDFKNQLNKVETREETILLYNEAIVELDKYGLLGKLSIEKAKNLVTGRYQNNKVTKLLEERYSKVQENSEDIENYLCLVAGRTTNTFIYTLPILSTFFIFLFFYYLGHLFDKGIIRDIQTFFADLLNFLLDYSCESRLIYFRNPIAYNYPGAEGWIYSIGIKGIQSINGTMRGTLFDRTDIDDLGFSIIGFKGLKICMNYPFDAFYIGHALALKIEHKNPKEV